MRFIFFIIFQLVTNSLMAQQSDSISAEPADFRWENRILVLISESESDSLYQQQMSEFSDKVAGFKDRDLITFSVFRNERSLFEGQELESSSAKTVLDKYGYGSPPFRIILIGKDGGVKLEREMPVTTENIFGLIDSMPMRQREMRQNGGRQ